MAKPQIINFVHRVFQPLFSPSILGGFQHPYFWRDTQMFTPTIGKPTISNPIWGPKKNAKKSEELLLPLRAKVLLHSQGIEHGNPRCPLTEVEGGPPCKHQPPVTMDKIAKPKQKDCQVWFRNPWWFLGVETQFFRVVSSDDKANPDIVMGWSSFQLLSYSTKRKRSPTRWFQSLKEKSVFVFSEQKNSLVGYLAWKTYRCFPAFVPLGTASPSWEDGRKISGSCTSWYLVDGGQIFRLQKPPPGPWMFWGGPCRK